MVENCAIQTLESVLGIDSVNSNENEDLFIGDNRLINEARMGGYKISSSTERQPVVATYGLGPCVSLVGYEPDKKIGFVTHFCGLDNAQNKYNELQRDLSERLGDSPSNFTVRLIGGWTDQSEEVIAFLKENLQFGNVRIQIQSEDTLGLVKSRDAILDTRDGKIYNGIAEQNVTQNPLY